MTAFRDDLVLPIDVRPDARFSAGFSTSIVALRGGGEYRNAQWAHPLRSFEVEYGARSQEQIEDHLLNFLMTTQGSLTGFRARDWSDHRARNDIFGTGDASAWWFRLYKPYGEYQRRIRKPDPTEPVTVIIDDVPLPPTEFAVDYNQGVVVFKTTPTIGAVLAWTGKFHVPCRFADDALSVMMHYYRVGSVERVGLQEVRLRDDIDTAALTTLRATL